MFCIIIITGVWLSDADVTKRRATCNKCWRTLSGIVFKLLHSRLSCKMIIGSESLATPIHSDGRDMVGSPCSAHNIWFTGVNDSGLAYIMAAGASQLQPWVSIEGCYSPIKFLPW